MIHGSRYICSQKKRAVDTRFLCSACVLQGLESLPRGWCHPEVGLPTAVGIVKTVPHLCAQRPIFQVILDSVRMT